MILLKLSLVVCGLALGAFSASNAFVNGMSLVPGVWGYAAGGALVAMLVWSGLCGELMFKAFACRAWFKGLVLLPQWVFAASFVMAMSIGFVATSRGDAVAGRQ